MKERRRRRWKAAQHEVLPPSEADVQTLVQPPPQPPSPHIFQHLIRSAYSSSSLFQSHFCLSLKDSFPLAFSLMFDCVFTSNKLPLHHHILPSLSSFPPPPFPSPPSHTTPVITLPSPRYADLGLNCGQPGPAQPLPGQACPHVELPSPIGGHQPNVGEVCERGIIGILWSPSQNNPLIRPSNYQLGPAEVGITWLTKNRPSKFALSNISKYFNMYLDNPYQNQRQCHQNMRPPSENLVFQPFCVWHLCVRLARDTWLEGVGGKERDWR